MRNPVLHIRLKDLERVLAQVGVKPELAFQIVSKAHSQGFQMRNRYFVQAKFKAKKKIERTIDSTNEITEQFNRIHNSILIEKQHKNIAKIFKDSKQYITLKEVAQVAYKYAEDFNYEPREEGYKAMIEIAMQIMGKKYTMPKIKYYLQKIYDVTECQILIKKDINPNGSRQFYLTWKIIAAKYSTANIDLLSQEDYLHIIYARDEADELQADYEDWITAQFDQLSFMNVIPELNQMYGINAKRRYSRYMGIKGKKEKGTLGNRQRTEYEQRYWDLLNSGKLKRGETE